MTTKLYLLALVFLLPSGTRHTTSSRIVVEDEPNACQQPEGDKLSTEFTIGGDFIEQDPDAKRFQDVFAEKLNASFGCASYLLPENGVRIHLVSTQVKDDRGEILGSAIVATAARRSSKDPHAETPLDLKHWFLRHDAPVEDTVQAYFDQLQDKLQ